jgi:glycine cleavage system H protein
LVKYKIIKIAKIICQAYYFLDKGEKPMIRNSELINFRKGEIMDLDRLKYHKEHAWVKVSGRKATIGITDYAQDSLGDIVYIELPEVDSDVEIDSEIGEIESTKATSSIISPISGRIVDINDELSESPELINEDPYGKGWIALLELEDISELDDLMDASEYAKYVEEEAQ